MEPKDYRKLPPPYAGRGTLSRSSTTSSIENARGASEREIAVELQKLHAVFGYEEGAWKLASGVYLDALSDIPADLLRDAVSTAIRQAGPDDRFPKPGHLRSFITERLSWRKQAADREIKAQQEEPGWPDWLAEIWGRAHEGPRARQRAGEAQNRRYLVSAAYRYQQDRGTIMPAGLGEDHPLVLEAVRIYEDHLAEENAKWPEPPPDGHPSEKEWRAAIASRARQFIAEFCSRGRQRRKT